MLELVNPDISVRQVGKQIKYQLGSIFRWNDYFLTAFSKFDSKNRAYLDMDDYIKFSLKFWDEIDCFYAGRSVTIPLLGSGITRFRDNNNITDQNY